MHKVFVIQEDKEMRDILNDTYDELLAALKSRNPRAKSLFESDEYSQLHDLLGLLRTGHIKISNGENMKGLFTMIEIKEDDDFFERK